MKDFSQIKEGLLAGQEETLKTGNDYAKKLKQAEEIKKNLFWLNILWNNSFCSNKTQDFFGRDVKVGDVVLATLSEGRANDLSYGIVIKEPDIYGECKIITGNARVEGKDFDDPYNDCICYYVAANKLFVLARRKKAKQMLQILENTI